MRNILAILIFTIFIFGCNDDGGKLFSSIDLVSPLETTVDYCDVAFEWEAKNIDGKFVIDIATDVNFENIIITDSTTLSSYSIDGNLQPNQEYYWKIMADDEGETGSFTTTDESDLQDFIGVFPMNVYSYHPGEPDQTWQDTLQISLVNDIPQLVGSGGNVIVQPDFFESRANCYELFYREFPNPGDPTVVVANRCTLDLQNRTFKFYKGHPSNHFDIYTEYTGSID